MKGWHAVVATVSRWIGAVGTVLKIIASGATSTHLHLKFSYLEIPNQACMYLTM